MTRHRVIAAVTAAFGHIVEAAASDAVGNVTVSYDRPDTAGTAPKLHIFMYQVTPNAAARNLELPTRNDDGTARQRPLLALDLHYLLTFVGDDRALEPQRMLGSVASTMHAYPVLWPADIRAAKDPLTDDFLVGPDDEVPIVNVRFTPLGLSLEELSKVWSVFFQTPYGLSMVYQASVVLVEHDLDIRPALPAQRSKAEGGILSNPVIAQVVSEQGLYQPVLAGGQIVITGTRLRGEQTWIRFVESGTDVEASDPREMRVVTTIPVEAQTIGLHSVRIVHRPWDALPGDTSNEVVSNPAGFVLYPEVTDVVLNGTILDIEVQPAVLQEQKAECLLDQLGPTNPVSRQLRRLAFTGASTTTLQFDITGIPSGSYAVRVRLDGIESRIEIDRDTETVITRVDIP